MPEYRKCSKIGRSYRFLLRATNTAPLSTIQPGLTCSDNCSKLMDFTADGQWLAVAHSDSTLRLWSARTGNGLPYAPGHNASVSAVAYSRDGSRVASSSLDQTI